ncbi:immunoglobulin-like domain-containing protein [Lentzea terrae]|uniref:immunoglobulin-like domain-containing protein n=1 Tax=Lentzea terrae TaxID=2200761 RepID=UPI000DD4EA0A|nr:immunoglobulin-like domain-containing protein [Lentzea terrae]
MSFRHFTFTSALLAVALSATGLAISVTTSAAATLDDGLVVHYDTSLGAEGLRLPGDVISGLTDVTVSVQADLGTGWRTITCTLDGGTATRYEDGVAISRKTGVTTTAAVDHFGNDLKGKIRDFRLYRRALSPGEARELGKTTASARPAADVATLSLADTATEDLALPAKAGGSVLSWESSKPSVVSATGLVTRPAPRAGNVTVTLTATATYAGYTATRDFTVTVPEDLTDRQKVDNALKDIVIHDEDAIRGNITLPAKGGRDVAFTWQSSDPRVVTTTGEVIRPPHGSRPRTARLSVRATKGYTSNTRYFSLTVLPLPKKVDMEGYLFTYSSNEQVRFAVSNDLVRWDVLNDLPVVRSEHRDPFLVRSQEGDRFFLVAGGGSQLEIRESTDLITWSDPRLSTVHSTTRDLRTVTVVLDGASRHGTALPVSKAELDRLRKGPPPVRANKKGVVADYDLTGGTGAAIADLSGNGRTATIRGDVSRSPAGLVFGGTDGYLDLPDNLTAGLNALTISAQVWVDPAQQGQYSLWDMGNANVDHAVSRGSWHTITCTLSNGTARLFDNNVEQTTVDGITAKPTENSAGKHFKGKMRRLTVWNRALNAEEIAAGRR